MELFEYIKSQLPQTPNTVIMKQLGASQELIDYVKETPENTNFAIAEVVGGSGEGGDAEVWLVGDTSETIEGMTTFTLQNAGQVDHLPELLSNGENYQVFLNDEELPYFTRGEHNVVWMDEESMGTSTKGIDISEDTDFHTYNGMAVYINISAPTSVEVSVKAK